MDFESWLTHIDYQHFAMQPAEVIKRALHMAWQASRENMQEYQKHEFCRDMNCSYLKKDKCELKPGCCNSARGFHLWLKENGYRIVRITSGSG